MLNYFVALQGFVAQRLGRDDRGATAVEYGLIVALIAAVIIGTVALLGTAVNTAFNAVLSKM
jgi:pilus assembly protein Flp/PilA